MFLHQAFLFLFEPGAVVALVRNTGAAVEFQNPFGRVVQKVAVVGDRYHGAGVTLQKLLQPIDRLGVQVVGGLVQQQHIGFGKQQTAQGHAALFTTRQNLDPGVPGRQAQGVGGNFQLVLGIGTGAADDGLHLGLFSRELVEVGVGLTVGGVDLVQPCLGLEQSAHAGLHAFTHALGRVELRLLWQITDVQIGHRRCLALDLLVHAGHDLEQGGLARAIGTQHADLRAGEKAQ